MDNNNGATPSEVTAIKPAFGTFKGVFIPSMLTIFGVIMYLRMGWVIDQVGLPGTLLIVTLASSITFITGMSIAATATNMKVGGGGAYYMISRSLGVELGAAVGIPLYLAQTFGISFYLAGFSESLVSMWPALNATYISMVCLVVLVALAFYSANWALKTQLVIFLVIIASLVSFFMGGQAASNAVGDAASSAAVSGPIGEAKSYGFWAVFAVFFPAVTGIEAGLALSGDLKKPEKSLPIGTLFAVTCGFIVYLLIPIYMHRIATPDMLRDPMVMHRVALIPELILAGIWGATLSSALGGVLGSPRTLQALARDRVVPRFLGKSFGTSTEPQMAIGISFAIAFASILIGDLNAIAPILSMFFLTSYGVLNISTALEGMMNNPSWRPKFKVPWMVSLIGGGLCFAAMFMVNPGATIISLILSFSVFYVMQRRNMRARWGDTRRGLLMFLARFSITHLSYLKVNAKSWRPHFIVMSGPPTTRWYLIELADAISQGKGFYTVATILKKTDKGIHRLEDVKSSIIDYLKKKNVPALVRVIEDENIKDGIVSLVQGYGLGPLIPNTVLLGESQHEEGIESYCEMLIKLYFLRRNIVIVRRNEDMPAPHKNKIIDVWWGRQKQNAALSLVLGYMLGESRAWDGAILRLNTITQSENEYNGAEKFLADFMAKSRIEAETHVILNKENKPVFDLIREKSLSSDLTFIGLAPPNPEKYMANKEEEVQRFVSYYKSILQNTSGYPMLAIVIAGQTIEYNEIIETG